MSTSYGYRCLTCIPCPEPDDHDHGEDVTCDGTGPFFRLPDTLAAWIRLAPFFKAIESNVAAHWIETRIMGYGPATVRWLARHAGHDIRVYDEYGREWSP